MLGLNRLFFKLAAVILLCVGSMTLSACHTMRFEVVNEQHDKVIDETNWFYMFGWFPTKEIDTSQYCPTGTAAVKEQTTFGDGFIELITIGIVSPRSVWYYCLPENNKGIALNTPNATKEIK